MTIRPESPRTRGPAYLVYSLLLTFAWALLWLLRPLARRHPRLGYGLDQRLGLDRPELGDDGRPRLWMHAASVGEVQVALTLITTLRKRFDFQAVLTVTSPQGHRLARDRVDADTRVTMAPLDAPRPVRRLIAAVRPDLFVVVETELWPVLLTELGRAGIGKAVVNGRLSARSTGRYQRMGRLMRSLVAEFDRVSVISEADAHRFRRLGVAPERIRIHGNAKYAAPVGDRAATRETIRKDLGLAGQPAFISGSTRSGEEEILIPVFQRLVRMNPDWHWIVAPRHLRRLDLVEGLLTKAGLNTARLSRCRRERRPARVILVDTMGELSDLYGAADLHFCGGSLVNRGGHNIMEVVRWGMPVYFGPFMEDFQDAADMVLAAGAGFQVRDGEELARLFARQQANPEQYHRAGRAAADLSRTLARTVDDQADMVLGLLRP